MAGAEPGGGLEEEELHMACIAEQGRTRWDCGEMGKGPLKEDRVLNVTLLAVG